MSINENDVAKEEIAVDGTPMIRDTNRAVSQQPEEVETRIKVTNVSPNATTEQMTKLFGYLGQVLDVKFQHSEHNSDSGSKTCIVRWPECNQCSHHPEVGAS
ncbi:hypothetical protein GZH46_03066, partial [Fragariocoptes setiger]